MTEHIRYVKCTFPQIVRDNLDSHRLPGIPDGYTFHFIQNILFYDKHWFKSAIRLYECTKYRKEYLVFSSIRVGGRIIHGFGVGRKLGKASDVSFFRIYQKLIRFKPAFFMVPNVIGLPNAIGHCYLICAVLPLLNCYPFLKVLLEVNEKITLLRTTRQLKEVAGKPYQVVESKYLWSVQLFKLHRSYFKVSDDGGFKECNTQVLCSRKSSKRSNSPVAEPNYNKPKADLLLHNSLVTGLCALLRDYCDGDYSEVGGDEREAYIDLLWKLASEDDSFLENFFLRFRVVYSCRRCVGGPFTENFVTPTIAMDTVNGFQTLLDRADWLCKVQDFYCPRIHAGSVCGGELRSVYEAEMLNAPLIICFLTTIDEDSDDKQIPDNLSLNANGVLHSYTRLLSTNAFKCWLDKDGKPYGPFFREPVEGDTFECWHTYATLKTDKGWIDVNNGKLFKCDSRLLYTTTIGTLHFYQQSLFDSYLPKLGSSVVYDPKDVKFVK